MAKHIDGDRTANRSLVGADNFNGINQLDAVKDFYRFQILNEKVLKLLNPLILSYKNVDMINLIDLDASYNNYLLTQIKEDSNYYNDKITYLRKFDYDSNLFNKYKQSFQAVLTGLKAAIAQQKTIIEITDDNKELLEYKNILTGSDTSKLIREYIIKRNNDLPVFDVTEILDLDLDIKPWYSEYLIKYGAPSGGVFDTEKLSVIVADLINKGIITMDEFVSDRLN
jgi:hypothetical protein